MRMPISVNFAATADSNTASVNAAATAKSNVATATAFTAAGYTKFRGNLGRQFVDWVKEESGIANGQQSSDIC